MATARPVPTFADTNVPDALNVDTVTASDPSTPLRLAPEVVNVATAVPSYVLLLAVTLEIVRAAGVILVEIIQRIERRVEVWRPPA